MTHSVAMLAPRDYASHRDIYISRLGDMGSKHNPRAQSPRGLFPVLPNAINLGDSGNTGNKYIASFVRRLIELHLSSVFASCM